MLKQFFQIILAIIFLGFGLVSCAGESNVNEEKTTATPTNTAENKTTATTQSTADSEVEIDWNANEFLIQEAGLAGVFTGQPLSRVENRIKKELLKNAEGEFVAYYFTSQDGKPLGYFTLDPEDQRLIGDVVVTSPEAATKHGIKVGSTFGELKAIAPNIEVHGSEIESRTQAYVGRMAYLLDVAFNTYDVDENQIKPDTRIKSIRLMRHSGKK